MRKVVAVVMSTLMLAGCTHVHPCNPSAPTVDLEEVNRSLVDRQVTVTLLDGTWTRADSAVIEQDSTFLTPMGRPSWLDAQPRVIGSALDTSEIRTIAVRQHGWREALRWSLWGLGLGAALGLVLGRSIDEGIGGQPVTADERSMNGMIGAIMFGLGGATVGAIGGVAIGSREVYDFTQAPAEASGSLQR